MAQSKCRGFSHEKLGGSFHGKLLIRYNELVNRAYFMDYKPTNITGGPHLFDDQIPPRHISRAFRPDPAEAPPGRRSAPPPWPGSRRPATVRASDLGAEAKGCHGLAMAKGGWFPSDVSFWLKSVYIYIYLYHYIVKPWFMINLGETSKKKYITIWLNHG